MIRNVEYVLWSDILEAVGRDVPDEGIFWEMVHLWCSNDYPEASNFFLRVDFYGMSCEASTPELEEFLGEVVRVLRGVSAGLEECCNVLVETRPAS